jgi:hypothetical protein
MRFRRRPIEHDESSCRPGPCAPGGARTCGRAGSRHRRHSPPSGAGVASWASSRLAIRSAAPSIAPSSRVRISASEPMPSDSSSGKPSSTPSGMLAGSSGVCSRDSHHAQRTGRRAARARCARASAGSSTPRPPDRRPGRRRPAVPAPHGDPSARAVATPNAAGARRRAAEHGSGGAGGPLQRLDRAGRTRSGTSVSPPRSSRHHHRRLSSCSSRPMQAVGRGRQRSARVRQPRRDRRRRRRTVALENRVDLHASHHRGSINLSAAVSGSISR